MAPHKHSPDSEITGQVGINIIEDVVLARKFRWHPAGPFDSGIDGRIELRDARAEQPLNLFVGVQSKCYERFTAEDEEGFEFLCSEAAATPSRSTAPASAASWSSRGP
jgi:hypothetical protein